MPKESSPAINLPFFSITTIYPGADPKSVEEQITQKIEDKLTSVKNISSVKSISTNNVSAITVQFKRWSDENTAYNDLKSKMDEVKTELPSDVQDIIVKSIDLTDMPVYTFSIVWNYYPSILYDKIRFLEDDLKRISWVDHLEMIWNYTPQIQVRFDYEKLKKYKLSISQIVWLLNNFIEKRPVDKKQLNNLLYSFEVSTYSLENCSWTDLISKLDCVKNQIKEISLINVNGANLRLKDIAQVSVSPPFYKKYSYIDGKSAITYMVYKTDWTDILNIVDRLRNYLNSKEKFFKDNNLRFKEVATSTTEVNKTFKTFTSNFRQTTLIILIIIWLFIWLKEAFGVFFAFPLVYLITFIFLNAIWYTFNSIVSFSLILTLWIMVDNLIVIIEWFDEWIKKWMDKYQSIAFSIKTYWKPLLAWNFTTIAMFFPLNFMLSGKMWEFMKYLPTTIDLTLIFSLIVAMLFLPVILTYLIKDKSWKLNTNIKTKDQINYETNNKVITSIMKIITYVLKHPKKVIFSFWLLFVISLFAFVKFWKIDFMPLTDKNNIYINIKYDNSVSLLENRKLSDKIYTWTKEYFDKNNPNIVKTTQINIWDYTSFAPLDKVVYNNSFNPELTTLNISLIDTDDRDEKDNAIRIFPQLNSYLHEKIKKLDKIKELNVFIKKNGPSSGKDVGFNIVVKNKSKNELEIGILAKVYKSMLPKLQKIPWTYGWSSSLEYTNWKIKIIYDLDKIKQFNLNLSDINMFLLSFYSKNWDYNGNWLNISNLSDMWKDIIPVVGYSIFSGLNVNLNSLLIPWTDIYLSQVVKNIKLKPELKYYKHEEWNLILKIESYKTPKSTLWPITTEINKIIKNYPQVQLSYAADVKDMQQSMKDLWMAFVIGIFLMFAVLVLNFGNYKQPLIVFSIIPLLFIWAWCLLITFSIPFWFAAQLGMFGLIWVGVNDAILLIERYNELMKEWLWQNKDKILLETIKSRLMPVFLTTLTTVLWLITLAIKDALWGSLALSFMWWLIVGTMIILIYIPAMLKIWGKK